MTIKLDISSTSVVVKCSECPHWYAFAWTKEAAHLSGDRHRIDVHDVEPARASDRERKRRERHALIL